jgi:site-specific recombinase XerD
MKKQRGVFEKVAGSGEWWVRYVDADNRLRREKVGSKSAAIALYRKRKTEALEGKKLPEKLRRLPVSFAEIAKDALTFSKAHKRTYSDDKQRMDRMLLWFKGRSAESITPQDIERHFAQGVTEHKWAPSTVNHHRSLLSLAYQLAIRNRKLSINPARQTKHRREDNSRVRYLTDAEESKLRAAVAARWPERLPELDLALHTGMRRSEMYGLDWEDVHRDRRLIRINLGKNGEARHVRLNAVALKALEQLAKGTDETGPVIRARSGEALQSPRHWFEKAVRDAGIENFHWHDLRHTFASRLTMKGVGIRAVQEALGHKSIAMTVRYSHLSPDFLQDAVDKLVAEPAESTDAKRTDTRTDTSDLATIESRSGSVH